MCFPLSGNILILDVDGLFWDTDSLMIALASSLFHMKINGTDVCQNLSLMSLEKVLDIFMTLKNKKLALDNRKNFFRKALQYGSLCKPHFGAVAAYKCLKSVFKDDILFVTCKPEITVSFMKQLVNRDETMSFNVQSIELNNETALGGSDSPLHFYSTKQDILCALTPKHHYTNTCFQFKSLSLFFITKQLQFVDLCLDYLKNKLQSTISKVVLGIKETFAKRSVLVYSPQDFSKIKDNTEIQKCLCQSIEDLNMEGILSENSCYTYNHHLESYRYMTKVCPMELHGSPQCPEAHFWSITQLLERDLLFDGIVIKGFGRGGKLLGIPTANLSANQSVDGQSLPFPGAYFGFSALFDNENLKAPKTSKWMYDTILSAGYNPYYNNDRLVVEPHLFHTFQNNFYGVRLRIVVVGILRPESTFSRFVQAIQLDCESARQKLMRLHENNPSLLIHYKKLLQQQLDSD